MSEEETREQIEELIDNEEPVKEAVCETIIEEVKEEEIKPKPKPKASRARAKPNIKIVKESVEPVEPIVETAEPILVEKPEPPNKKYKLKGIFKCPDCNMDMTVKADIKAAPEPEKTPEPVAQHKPNNTEHIANYYIKLNPEIVSTYLRNERSMNAQKIQMHVRTLLNNAF